MLSFDPERIWMSEAWCHMICRAGDVRSFHVTWHVWALSRWWEKWDGDYRFHLGDFGKCVYPPCKWVLMCSHRILWISSSRLVLCHYTGCVCGLSPVLFPVAHQRYVTFLTISWKIPLQRESTVVRMLRTTFSRMIFFTTLPGGNCVFVLCGWSCKLYYWSHESNILSLFVFLKWFFSLQCFTGFKSLILLTTDHWLSLETFFFWHFASF